MVFRVPVLRHKCQRIVAIFSVSISRCTIDFKKYAKLVTDQFAAHVSREIIVFLAHWSCAKAEIRKRNYHARVSPEVACINTAVARYAKGGKCKTT